MNPLCAIIFAASLLFSCGQDSVRRTTVSINGDQFYINGKPTYTNSEWKGNKIEGLLFNSRMVQGIFDDENSDTRDRFKYPDTGEWDANRNTDEFVQAMQSWRDHGMLAFTINMQGGSPMGYGNKGWRNSSFDSKGNLKEVYIKRLEKIINKADELGMVVILGYFYFGQDEYFENEQAVIAAVDNATNWLLDKGYTNVVIEVANECNNTKYDFDIIKTTRIDELMRQIKAISNGNLLVATSYNGNTLPTPNVVKESDFILIHGNGVKEPTRIMEMVSQTKEIEGYKKMPIVFNEDDHFEFEKDTCNMTAAVMSYASWGYFDFRMDGESYDEGYQSVPVNWAISSERKKGFFNKVKEITGY
ncbi:MAG: hypothetical protein JXQ96_10045 [Cyclobacteriaceae bacterium]